MTQDISTNDTAYKQFIEQATTTKLVWGLKNKNGWANSHSATTEDVTVIPFWSDKTLARASAKDEWKSYLPVHIPLAEFLESWCMEMAEEDILMGVNWDANMHGAESGAAQVALDILNQLNSMAANISLTNYATINDFITAINEIVD
jgi:hypothetical protein